MRAANVIGVIAAAAGLTACSTAAPRPSALGHSSAAVGTGSGAWSVPPKATEPSFRTPSPTAEFLPATGPPCRAGQLQTMVVGEVAAGAGSGETLVVFTDVGSTPCTLNGTPLVRFLGADGQVLTGVGITHTTSGPFPVWPNNGVGLIPMAPPMPREAVRGQAALPLEYAHFMCAAPIATIEVTLPSGTLRDAMGWDRLQGINDPECVPPDIDVFPFEPAEAYR